MSLPGFLIVGGMKCGSTTLYRDLATSPDIHFPLDKEPGNLTDDRVLGHDGLAEYESLFERATQNQLCAEASTNYTKIPMYEGVPARAREVLGPDLKIIYIIRHPLDRVESHMRHNIANGRWSPQPPEVLLREHQDLIWFSSYGMQIEPWIEQFGTDQVRLLRLDDYMKNRRDRCVELWDWLGVESCPEGIDQEKAYNASASKPILRGPFAWVPSNPIYKNIVRPLFSNGTRDKIRHVLLPKNKVTVHSLDLVLKREVVEMLKAEPEKLAQIDPACFMGPRICWDDWFSHGLDLKELTK